MTKNNIKIIRGVDTSEEELDFTEAELKEIQWQLKRYEWHDLDAKQSALKKVELILRK